MKLLRRMEMNLGLELRPLSKSLAREKYHFSLDALKLRPRRISWSIVQIPDVQIELTLSTPTIAVVAMLTGRTEPDAKPRSHALRSDADVNWNATS